MRILIADDEPKMGFLLSTRLEEEGHFVKTVTGGKEALIQLENGYDLLITDLKMPDMNGVILLEKAKNRFSGLRVILMTAYASVDTAISAMKAGAEDYIIKPFPMDEMVRLVEKVDQARKLNQEVNFRRGDEIGEVIIVGKTACMREVFEIIDKVACTDATVLILGESGTGKELAARSIHLKSNRVNAPFIAINCASLSEHLLESELFGHEKGAFTGAHKAKPGRFELADGGTLFLDEIGELPGGIQAKLLRAIQNGVINRVGGVNPIKVDIRLIAATNRDLKTAMENGAFREDLYYRLAVFPIRMPSLAERREDIPELISHFLAEKSYTGGIEKDAIEILKQAPWRGNVRELFNVVERATILAEGGLIDSNHLPQIKAGDNSAIKVGVGKMTLDEMERTAILAAIRRSKGNKTEAAKILGITRRMIYSRMKKLGLTEDDIEGA
ncbi:MAG: sigma-54-dependent transcriptional regulator [bacterium]